MANHKLADFVRDAYQKLRGLAAEFNRPGNEQAHAVLSSLEAPPLPEGVTDLPVEFPHAPADTIASSEDAAVNAALAEATKLERAADVLGNAGRYEAVDRLSADATRVKDAVIIRDATP